MFCVIVSSGKEEAAMSYFKSSKIKRTAAGIIILMMLVFVLFSAFYIAIEADHDCTGEDCPICACIQQCENVLRSLGDGVALQLSALVSIVFILLNAVSFAKVFPQETPVSRKVRLNN